MRACPCRLRSQRLRRAQVFSGGPSPLPLSHPGEGFPAPPAPKLFPARRLILRALSQMRGSGAPRGAGSDIRFRELRMRRGWIEPPSARPVALRQRRFESSGPRFCRAGLCSRRGLASSSRRDRSVPRSVPEASRERGATLARRRRTHPAKRHASGWPPLGDGMRRSIREVRRAGISSLSIPAARGNRDRTPLPDGRGAGVRYTPLDPLSEH